jgi:adenine phosphoribosyltransferase
MNDTVIQEIYDSILDVPDFPKPGIVFKDITPLLMKPELFHKSVELAIAPFRNSGVQKILGIESRGFIFGVPSSQQLDVGLVLARKPGKLPRETVKVEYELEYGTDTIEVHAEDIQAGDKVLVVDDVLATGGTAAAAVKAVKEAGGIVVGCSFLMEIEFLKGRARLEGLATNCVLSY